MISKFKNIVLNILNKKVLGHVDIFNEEVVSGWIYNQAKPNQEITLKIYLDDLFVGEIVANQFREDLQRLGMGSGKHGFTLKIPESIQLPEKGNIILTSKEIDKPISILPSSLKEFILKQEYRKSTSFNALPKQVQLILESKIFCLDFYNRQFKQKFTDLNTAVLHYWNYGAAEGKSPHYFFDGPFYLDNSPDVKKNNLNPLYHYITNGWKEKRNPITNFFGEVYFSLYHTEKTENPLSHFLKTYVEENDSVDKKNNPELFFDADYYLTDNPDVKNLGLNPALHFFNFGFKEGRHPNSLFNTSFYKLNNPDVGQSNLNPYFHYLFFGKSEGRKIKKFINLKALKQSLSTEKPKEIKHQKVDLILPIYNGFDFVKDLLPNLKRATEIPFHLIIINDASPDEKIAPFIEKSKNDFKEITIITNPKNLGFVKSVNVGLKHAKNDVVILNSDTVLPNNWLQRMMYPIWTNPKIASVTPFTNSGTIASYPIVLKDNDIFLNLNVNQIDSVFNPYNPNAYIDCPTGVGFCMAMSKIAISKVGGFDEESFEKGYGEENDWCRRVAKNGFRNIIIPNLFIWHKHGGSFTTKEKENLIAKNTKNLVKKHPEYFDEVRKHISSDALDSQRFYAAIKHCELKATSGVSLFIDHRIGGGANSYLDKIIEVDKESSPVLLLSYNFKLHCNQVKLYYKSETIVRYFENEIDVFEFLGLLNLSKIFYNNLVSFKNIEQTLKLLINLKQNKKVPISIAIHDFYPVCQSFTLINEKGKFCGAETDPKVCASCIKSNINYEDKSISIETWRKLWENLLEVSEEIICFSESSKTLISKVYHSNENIAKALKVIPHVLPEAIPNKPVLSILEELHIGVLGTINKHKGAEVINSIIQYLDEKESGKLTIIGNLSQQTISSNRFHQTGKYRPNQLPKLIENSGTNVFLFPSIWPETFSFVTDELITMDVPVVCFDIGAPAERIKKYRKGKVIPLNATTEEIINALKTLNKDFLHERKHYIKQKLKNTPLFDPEYYMAKHPDIANASVDPYFHYILYGAFEGRKPSKEFDSKFYLDSNFDVKSQGLNPLIHYLDFGKAEGRLPTATSQYNLFKENIQILPNLKVAVLIHGFYEDLILELLNQTKTLPTKYDIFISVISKEGENIVKAWQKKNPNLKIHLKKVENRGRDIAPAFISFAKELKNYDLVCKIHTKKSLYTGAEQTTWRKQLIHNLLGSKKIAENIIYLFQEDPKLGMVYPFSKLLPYWAYSWLSNKHVAQPLQNKIGVHLNTNGYIDYPMGSMFWFRPQALEQLFSGKIAISDFKAEPCGNDGTFAHAIERAFIDIVKHNKYNYVELNFENNSYAKNSGTKNFYQYTQKSKEHLLNEIKNYDIISFDIFDTLLTRKVLFPDEIMWLVELKLNKCFKIQTNFFELRKLSEQNARETLKKDVSYSDIYNSLKEISNLSANIIAEAKKLEFDLEKENLIPREEMVEIFMECIKEKKQVWLVSDMYLEKSQIEELLKINMLSGYDKLVVSNSYNARKDDGKLWEILIKNEIENKTKFLHIGDNEHSDIQQTIDRGLKNYHVLSGFNLFANSPLSKNYINTFSNWQNDKFLGPIISKIFNTPFVSQASNSLAPKKFTTAFNSGYVAFGPIILSYLIWLCKKAKEDKISKFYFLAREGYFLKPFYDNFKKLPQVIEEFGSLPESEYLLISRRAIMGAVEKTEENLLDILSNNSFDGKLGDFVFHRLGLKLDSNEFPEVEQIISLPKQIESVKSLIQNFLPLIKNQSNQECDTFNMYLTQIGFYKEEMPGLVDVGYSGTIQKFLYKITNKPQKGYYFITKEITKTFSNEQNQITGYFENNAKKSSETPILKFNLYLEFWLTSNQGQLLNFMNKNGEVTPNFKEKEPAKKDFDVNENLSKGCMQFIEDTVGLSTSNIDSIGLNSEKAQYFFEQVVRNDLWDEETRKIAFLEDEFCGNNQNLNIISDYKKLVL